jgi:hypothetical protein
MGSDQQGLVVTVEFEQPLGGAAYPLDVCAIDTEAEPITGVVWLVQGNRVAAVSPRWGDDGFPRAGDTVKVRMERMSSMASGLWPLHWRADDGQPTTQAASCRGWRVWAIGLAAWLTMTLAVPTALADEHEGIYPPYPGRFSDDVVCTPEVVAPRGTVTCTASGAEDISQLLYWYATVRPPADWDEGLSATWDRDDYDTYRTLIDWYQVEFVGPLTVSVETDGTAVISFDVTTEARDGDWYVINAEGEGPREDCLVVDHETLEMLGRGAFEGGDDDGFFVNGVRYFWDDAFYSCLDDFDGFTFGQFAGSDDDADEDATGDGAAGAGEDAEEGTAVPEPTTPTT